MAAAPVCKSFPSKQAATLAKACQADQDTYYNDHKGEFWGGAGFEKTMSLIFSKDGSQRLFPTDRHINLVHVGAHLGSMLDRYFSLLRGPRLDDRLLMIEANPENVKRLRKRSRRDPRLTVLQAAVAERDGPRMFKYGGVPNTLGNGGRITADTPTNMTYEDETGYVLPAATLDTYAKQLAGPIDFLMMDAEGFEARSFLAAPEFLNRLRFAVFGCSERWKEWDADVDGAKVFAAMEAAGLTTVLLGDKRNLILDAAVMPTNMGTRLVSWGFCAAFRTRPSAIADVVALSGLVAASNYSALDSAHAAHGCYKHAMSVACAQQESKLRTGNHAS